MANCTSCNSQIGIMEGLMQRGTGRCKKCNAKFNPIRDHFFQQIDGAFQNKMLTIDVENRIYQDVRVSQLPSDLAQSVVTKLRQLRALTIQKELQNEIEYHFKQGSLIDISEKIALATSQLPQTLAAPVLQRLGYLKGIAEIQRGNIPRIASSLHLDSDEYAHFEMRATHYKHNKNIKELPGRLIGTNKKCYFVSDSGSDSATIDWNNVGQVEEQSLRLEHKTKVGSQTVIQHKTVQVLHVSVTRGSGGGGYGVSDRYYTKILIDTIVRLWKRQLVIYAETKTQGSIPDHVKAAVFHRDGGKCVQCSYEGPYIEYDHRIPRSKGGQNTVENIQLLCRMCNLKKSNRL